MTEKLILGVAPVVRGRWRVDHLAEVEQVPVAPPADTPEGTATDVTATDEAATPEVATPLV